MCCCKCTCKPIQETKPFEFQDGDIAEYFIGGPRGTVRIEKGARYPVVLYVNDIPLETFTLDGRTMDTYKIPFLVLVERSKKKVMKAIERWINIYPDEKIDSIHSSEIEANKTVICTRIACLKFTSEYEVEGEV